jgi:DNA-binding NtrC family response regulator
MTNNVAESGALMQRVLVVDNQPTMCFAIAAILQLAGYETVEADNGRTALNILSRDTDFAVVLSDIQMPHLDGLQLLEHMQQHHAAIPVIIVSGLAQRMGEARTQGAVACLSKPFTRHQLLNTVYMAVQGVAQAV